MKKVFELAKQYGISASNIYAAYKAGKIKGKEQEVVKRVLLIDEDSFRSYFINARTLNIFFGRANKKDRKGYCILFYNEKERTYRSKSKLLLHVVEEAGSNKKCIEIPLPRRDKEAFAVLATVIVKKLKNLHKDKILSKEIKDFNYKEYMKGLREYEKNRRK